MPEIKTLSFRKNFSWNFLGSLVYSLSQWLVLVLLARLSTPDMVGLYSLGLAYTAPILMFTNLQLRAVQATDTTFEYKFSDYFGLRIASSLVVILIVLIIIAVDGFNYYRSTIIMLVASLKIFDSYSDIVYGQLQQIERMDYIGKSRILKGIVTLLVMGIFLYVTNDLLISLIALNVSWLFLFLVYDRNNLTLFTENPTPRFNARKMVKLIALTLPLGIVLMLNSLNTNIPRIIVEKYLGEYALGYFAAIAYLMVAGNIFINAVGQAAAPRLAKLYQSKNLRKYSGLLIKLMGCGFLVGIVGLTIAIFFGELVLTIIYGTSYSQYNNIFILIMCASVFNFSSAFLGYGLTSMRLFKIQPYLGTIGTFFSIIMSIVFIPFFGLKGAAFSLIVTSFVQFVLMLSVIIYNLKKHQKISHVK